MRKFTPEEIESKTLKLAKELQDAGWDGTYLFRSEQSASSEKELTAKLLNQSTVLGPQTNNEYKTDHPVIATGCAVSFSGIMSTEYPSLQSVFGSVQDNPDDSKMAEQASELMSYIHLKDPDHPELDPSQILKNAEEKAEILIKGYPNFKKYLRGFLRVLTPYKYSGSLDEK